MNLEYVEVISHAIRLAVLKHVTSNRHSTVLIFLQILYIDKYVTYKLILP